MFALLTSVHILHFFKAISNGFESDQQVNSPRDVLGRAARFLLLGKHLPHYVSKYRPFHGLVMLHIYIFISLKDFPGVDCNIPTDSMAHP